MISTRCLSFSRMISSSFCLAARCSDLLCLVDLACILNHNNEFRPKSRMLPTKAGCLSLLRVQQSCSCERLSVKRLHEKEHLPATKDGVRDKGRCRLPHCWCPFSLQTVQDAQSVPPAEVPYRNKRHSLPQINISKFCGCQM